MIGLLLQRLANSSRALKLEYRIFYRKGDIYYVTGIEIGAYPIKSLSNSRNKFINGRLKSKFISAIYNNRTVKHSSDILRHPGIGVEVIMHSRVLKNK